VVLFKKPLNLGHNISPQVFAGRTVGFERAHDDIWVVSFVFMIRVSS